MRDRILNLTQSFYSESRNPDTLRAGWFYLDGNVIEGYKEISQDNWDGGVQVKNITEEMINQSKLTSPVEHAAIETDSAKKAYKKVLQNAGASLQRDAVDKRIIHEATTGKESFGTKFRDGGNGIIDSQKDVGGWPILRSIPPPPDTDNDGMPDEWERQNGLNPEKADNNDYKLNKDYTNIEVYLNSIVSKKK